jgi:membrane complex biogenesis BtpA family protein
MTWLKELFGVEPAVIGMCHLMALPGDPGYDAEAGLSVVIERAKADLRALQDGGVDGVMFSNEFSLPYLTTTEPITAICMARILGEIRSDVRVPFGVNVLWDGVASVDLAVATGASFVREIFTGVYASDFGMWNTDVGTTARHRRRVHGDDVRLLFNVVPEAASYLGKRDLADITRSTIFNARPDGICVSGLIAGSATDPAELREVKDVAGDTPVFVNTGVTPGNVVQQLRIADGAVVGTYFKRDGRFENPTDVTRVREIMDIVRQHREK